MLRPVGDGQLFVGIDVGGRADKGYEVCAALWRDGALVDLQFARMPHVMPLPETGLLRGAIATAGFAAFVEATARAAACASRHLVDELALLRRAPCGVFIDSPSAFSRNGSGHGRRTEKHSIAGVRFQSTPSVSCGASHGGDWAWLVYGMIAFGAVALGRELGPDEWRHGLEEGWYRRYLRSPVAIRECFPSATIGLLRAMGRSEDLRSILSRPGTVVAQEVDVVLSWLDKGVSKGRSAIYDRADALVASLSGVAFASLGFGEKELDNNDATTWIPGCNDASEIEGRIVVLS